MGSSTDNESLFKELEALETEQRNPRTYGIDLENPLGIVKAIYQEDLAVANAIEQKLPLIAEGVELVHRALKEGGRLLYFGAGTSGRLGVLDASECPPTFGTPSNMVQGFIAGGRKAMFVAQEGAEDNPENGVEDLAASGAVPPDLVCGIAASGRTPYVHGALAEAAARGCKTILVTTVPAKQVKIETDLKIDIVVGPEVIMGSTRMKSATAQKMVLNMLTTGAMIRMGKVYENVMVDLMLTNEKLKERAKRILMLLTGISYIQAQKRLDSANGHVKTALLMEIAGVDMERASQMLEKHEGRIREALLDR